MTRREYLREHGPTPASEWPYSGLGYGCDGERVRRAKIGGSRHAGKGVVGQPEPVYYIPANDDEAIVRAVLDANPGLLDKPQGAITRAFGDHSQALKEAWREIADEYRDELAPPAGGFINGGGGDTRSPCPICGADVTAREKPSHITACANGGDTA